MFLNHSHKFVLSLSLSLMTMFEPTISSSGAWNLASSVITIIIIIITIIIIIKTIMIISILHFAVYDAN